MKVLKWFKAWFGIDHPFMFNYKYNKMYDKFINKVINEGTFHSLCYCGIIFTLKDTKIEIWTGNKFYAYANLLRVNDIEIEKLRPSIKTMHKLYCIEKEANINNRNYIKIANENKLINLVKNTK